MPFLMRMVTNFSFPLVSQELKNHNKQTLAELAALKEQVRTVRRSGTGSVPSSKRSERAARAAFEVLDRILRPSVAPAFKIFEIQPKAIIELDLLNPWSNDPAVMIKSRELPNLTRFFHDLDVIHQVRKLEVKATLRTNKNSDMPRSLKPELHFS